MKTLREVIADAESKKIAIGHFNISDLAMLKAIFEAAKVLGQPVIIGTSEGEREFIDPHEAVAMVKALREEFNYPIYLNADHTHSLDKVKEAVELGYDAILFDGSKLPLEENISQTKQAVQIIKSINPEIITEGELGYIGSGSEILTEIPAGAAIKPEDLTKPEEAERFVKETGVDMLAPAVGNLHGMFLNAPEPKLDISRIQDIKNAIKIPLVLHGGSGNSPEDLASAIRAGTSIVHISTEIRAAWKKGMEEGLKGSGTEIAPYKIYPEAIREIEEVVKAKLQIFSNPGN
jgi:fructose-bisphosphate aldolase class II